MNSQVPEGYQQTEVGVIPDDWTISTLSEHASFQTGPFGSLLHKSDYIVGGVPLINPMHINNGKIEPTISMSVTGDVAKKLSNFHLHSGDIVIGRRGEMGRCAYVHTNEEGWLCGSGSMIIKVFSGTDARFIQRVLSSPATVDAVESASVGTTMINLNQKSLSGLKIAIPSTEIEQCAIASTLSDIDSLLASLDQLIAKKRDLKQAAMQQLLTGKRRLPGFGKGKSSKLTSIGVIPEDWTTQHLGMLIEDLQAGVSVNSTENARDSYSQEFSVLKTSSIFNGYFFPDERKAIVPKDIERARISPKKDTIIISRMNTPNLVGECGYIDDDYENIFLPDRLWITNFKQRNNVCVRWLAYILSYEPYKKTIKESATGTSGSMKNIAKENLLHIEIPYFEKKEQKAIATILTDIDTEITTLQTRRTKTQALKQAMMQQLLTGQTRLVTPQAAK